MRAIRSGTISALTPTSLTNNSAAGTPGALKGLKINPNIAQDATFSVVENDATTLYIDPAEGDLTQAASMGNTYTGVYSFNAMKVIGASKVRCDDRFVIDSGLTIDGSTFVTTGITADMVTLTNGGVLTHGAATTTTVYSLDLNTATSLTIDASSRIDVAGKGYLGGYQGGNSTNNGRTYGNTTMNGSTTQNGGSYGGLGGLFYTASNGMVNAVYGNIMDPNEVGSGGGAYSNGWPGGNGGGLVKIRATSLTVDGSIVADGAGAINASGAAEGAGSGGGILINVSTLSGSGTISAKGGASIYNSTQASGGGAGGGGRIAVYYDTMTLPTANIVASGGKSGDGSKSSYNGGAGTVYLKSTAQSQGDLVIDNRSTTSSDSSTPIQAIGSGTISALTPTSLTNNSAAWTPGALKGLKINPNIAQDATFSVVENDATTLYIDPAEGDLTQAASMGNTYTGVYSFNAMKVIGASKVRCDDRFVIDSGLTIDGSTFVTTGITADMVTLTNGGVLTHGAATTTTVYSLDLNTATSLTIDASSRIDVAGKGYLGGYQGGNSTNNGRTYGNTTMNGSTTQNGGSYGGLGGLFYTASNGMVNAVYGNIMDPNEVGSGGGAYSNGWPGGNGGGLVKIRATSLTVDGSIVADGAGAINASGATEGAGSGGGILINVSTLSGSGTISAKGGASVASYASGLPSAGGGAGGGGRIAVYYDMLTLPAANIIASGGKSGDGRKPAYNGQDVPVYLQQR